jgi:hypothetical protein
MVDILTVTKELMELFEKHELSKIQCIFVLEAARMGVNEEMMKEVIEDSRKGYTEAGLNGIH